MFLVEDVKHQIRGSKLLFNGLAVLFYSIHKVKLIINESSNLAIRECVIFWGKARSHEIINELCKKNLLTYIKFDGTYKKMQRKHKLYSNNVNNIAHADALKLIKTNEDLIFLKFQREPGRVDYLGGVNKKLTEKEKRGRLRATPEKNQRMKHLSEQNFWWKNRFTK